MDSSPISRVTLFHYIAQIQHESCKMGWRAMKINIFSISGKFSYPRQEFKYIISTW